MAEADTQTGDRCKALTDAGDRCSRPAQDDDFCYQHDESDPTVSETDQQQQSQEEGEQGQEQQNQNEEQQQQDQETGTESDVDTSDPEDVDASDVEADDDRIEGILGVRKTVDSTAGELIGRPLSGVIEIEPVEDGWRGVVEVVERSSIPDTQDILGRYEIDLDEDGVVQGYRRLDRYRRDDTTGRE